MLGRGRTGMLETIPMVLGALNRKDRMRQVVSFCHRMPFFFEAGKGINAEAVCLGACSG